MSKKSKMPRQPTCGPMVGLKPKSTFVYRPVSTNKAEKANGNPKVQMANKATPSLTSFDALCTLADEEEGGGNQTLSTNATRVVALINELES